MGIQFQFDFSELEEYANTIENAVPQISKGLEKILVKIANKAIANIKLRTPVDTGELRNNWTLKDFTHTAGSFSITIYNPLEYASFIEEGYRQKARWVPGTFVGTKFKYQKGAKTGIMLRTRWKPGHWMVKVSLDEIERELPNIWKQEFNQLLVSLGVGGTS